MASRENTILDMRVCSRPLLLVIKAYKPTVISTCVVGIAAD